MNVTVLRCKIHNCIVTNAQIDYVGSITIDENLMDASGLVKNERVLVVNNATGARLETYVIVGKRGSGIICLNGAAAHHFKMGDGAIIMSFTQLPIQKVEEHEPIVIFPYNGNKEWKINEEICVDLLREVLNESGEIHESDIEKISLQMGRPETQIRILAQRVISEKEGE